MSIDLPAAERFVLSTARLLDRHLLAVLLHDAPTDAALAALAAYRNADGGFGHALEPDVRTPASETTCTLHAFDVLDELGHPDHPWVADGAAWVASVALPDGGVPFVLPGAAAAPHAPWMVPSDGGSHLTYGFAAALHRIGATASWLDAGTAWCWAQLEGDDALPAYSVKYALRFLDAVPDETRATAALDRIAGLLDADGSLPVAGGQEDERLAALDLAPRPGARSRALITSEQVAAGLDRIEAGQAGDGGWTFDWLAWSAGQEVESRGQVTVGALAVLAAHGRLPR